MRWLVKNAGAKGGSSGDFAMCRKRGKKVQRREDATAAPKRIALLGEEGRKEETDGRTDGQGEGMRVIKGSIKITAASEESARRQVFYFLSIAEGLDVEFLRWPVGGYYCDKDDGVG